MTNKKEPYRAITSTTSGQVCQQFVTVVTSCDYFKNIIYAESSSESSDIFQSKKQGYVEAGFLFDESEDRAINDMLANSEIIDPNVPEATIGKVTPKMGATKDTNHSDGYRWKTLKDYNWLERIIIWFQT